MWVCICAVTTQVSLWGEKKREAQFFPKSVVVCDTWTVVQTKITRPGGKTWEAYMY